MSLKRKTSHNFFKETEGVTVATFGESKNFPAFFTRNSGFPSPYNIASVDEAAKLLAAHNQLSMDSGMLLAAPIPNDLEEMGNAISDAINKALSESKLENLFCTNNKVNFDA